MNKGTHFIGQPMFGQLISLLDKSKILRFSHENGGEKYVKHFDAWQHLIIMLYAVIKRFDSLREITNSAAYRDLYATYRDELSSDSRKRQTPKWLSRLQIIDSTTITLFSNIIFKGVGRHPKTGRKKSPPELTLFD